MSVHVCEFHDTEVGFVAAIPLDLVTEATNENVLPWNLLAEILSPVDWLYTHVQANERCSERMSAHLLRRMSLALQCLNIWNMLVQTGNTVRDDHLRWCSRCQSKLGWVKGKLNFRKEFEKKPTT